MPRTRPARFRQLSIAPGPASVGRCLTRSETDYAGFYATLCIEAQRSTEGACLVVWMSSDAHEPKHAEIVADVQSFAEIMQWFAEIRLRLNI